MLLRKVDDALPEPEPKPEPEPASQPEQLLDVAALDLNKLTPVPLQDEPLPIELLAAGGKVCWVSTWRPCLLGSLDGCAAPAMASMAQPSCQPTSICALRCMLHPSYLSTSIPIMQRYL